MKSVIKRLKLHNRQNQKTTLAIIAFAIVGSILLIATRAAAPFASTEPENGMLSRSDLVINDPTASGSMAVQFKAASNPTSSGVCTARSAPTAELPYGGVPADKFPGAACTGTLPGVARTTFNGDITTSSDGQVIQNMTINGGIRVNHANVVIRNVLFRNNGASAVYINESINPGARNLLIEDCEMDGTGPNNEAAVSEHNYTIRRCHVHNYGEGLRANGNTVIEDNYIHTFTDFSAPTPESPEGAHQDTIQTTGGDNLTIRHNNMEMNIDAGNAVIMVGTYSGSNLLVENNLLAGGGWVTYTGGPEGSSSDWTNVRYLNNKFSTRYFEKSGFHGPIATTPDTVLTGNIWYDDYGTGDYSTPRQYPNGDGPRKGQPL